jgi:hypothetical protein
MGVPVTGQLGSELAVGLFRINEPNGALLALLVIERSIAGDDASFLRLGFSDTSHLLDLNLYPRDLPS